MRGVAFVAAACVALLCGGGSAQEGVGEPVKLVRTLQFLQDVVVKGEAASEDARRNLIGVIGKRFLEADPEIWRDRRNEDAALLYVLNGGNPAVLAKLPKSDDDARREGLIAAVAAYASGSMAEARKLWADVDIGTLPPGLVGPAALVKANLLLDADPAQALHFADVARLESPGTLVEEAAIRRGIEIAAKLGDKSRFEFYTVSYATRFPRSMYGASFRQRFAESYLAVASKGDVRDALPLDAMLEPLAVVDRREIFLEVARRALLDAKMGLAKSSAESGALLAEPGSAEMRRAELYRGAAMAISREPDGAGETLRALPAEELTIGDRALLQAVLGLVEHIQRWPEAAGADPAAGEDGGSGDAEIDAIAAQAKQTVAKAASTLAEVSQ